MDSRWRSSVLALILIGIFLNHSHCYAAKTKQIPKAPARVLAERAGAAHYEERYEKVLPVEDSREHHLRKRASDEDFDYEVYQGVVGRPGIDFPILPRIPQTTFSCRTFGNGYFADLETDCQVFHICDDGRKISFLCPNGTIFQQSELICDWWFKVNCPASPGHYAESSEILSKAQNRRLRPYTSDSSRESSSSGRGGRKGGNGGTGGTGGTGGSGSSGSDGGSKRVENEFYSQNGYSSSRSRLGEGAQNKNQYPIKNNKRYESREKSSGENSKRYESVEDPSVENFDFEDISEGNRNSQRYNNKKDKIVAPRKDLSGNEAESQDVAESASFVGANGQRRNGYNYEPPSREGKKSYTSEKEAQRGSSTGSGSEGRSKTERGRQKFNSSELSGRNSDQDTSSQENRDTGRRTGKGRQPSSSEVDSQSPAISKETTEERNTPSLIHNFNDRSSTSSPTSDRGRSSTYTTARKLESSRTTPYYTPTVPTISVTPSDKVTESIDGTKVQTEYKEDRKGNKLATGLRDENKFGGSISLNTSSVGSKIDKSGPELQKTNQINDLSVNKVSKDAIKANITAEGAPGVKLPPPGSSKGQTSTKLDSSINTNLSAISVLTPKPIIIGMRGTLPTDAEAESVSQQTLTTSVLSNGSYAGRKLSDQPRENAIFSSRAGTGSSELLKPTTFKPSSSSSGPTYLPTTIRPSSSGPTYLPTTPPTTGSRNDVSERVKGMINGLNELKNDIKSVKGKSSTKSRPGLEIPPSSGPDTLHSLAVYFAGENESTSTSETLETDIATDKNVNISSGLLSNKTVQSYESLFGIGTTEKSTEPTIASDSRPGYATTESNDLEGQHSSNLLGDAAGKPETRKIAQVFTNALSAYLENPDEFRKALSEVRPTPPPGTENFETDTRSTTTNPFFNRGTAASYLPTAPTTVVPSTTTEDLEVLDFSDVTITNKSRVRGEIPTTGGTITERHGVKSVDRVPASRLITTGSKSIESNLKETTASSVTPNPNQIAFEINKGLGISTFAPNRISLDLTAPDFSFTSTTFEPEVTTFNKIRDPLTLNLLPPSSQSNSNDFNAPSSDILPPGIDDDEDTLQRAQSQSFIASRNELANAARARAKTTKVPGHYITKPSVDQQKTATTTENPWTSPAFLDPLTINDGLMGDLKTTTPSPYTYLPKGPTTTTTESSPTHIDLNTALANMQLHSEVKGSSKPSSTRIAIGADGTEIERLGIADIPYSILPPPDGMQRIANKMFGGLNESSAEHLMNVMRKAEDNQTIRRLILLLIQTCDDDYSKTFEQSRQALLNALIGMDDRLNFEDEIEVIRLKPNRRGKSVDGSSASLRNHVQQRSDTTPSPTRTTTDIPITTYRGISNIKSLLSTTPPPSPQLSTTISPESSSSSSSVLSSSRHGKGKVSLTTTTQNPLEETTRFEIRVEDVDEFSSTSSTINPDSQEVSTTPSGVPTTTSQPSVQITTTVPPITTSRRNLNLRSSSATLTPILLQNESSSSNKRTAKDLDKTLGIQDLDPLTLSHKSSDERALELLKSLYSLASKFGRR